ncbi:MAG: 23S rRNA (adenine(2503)-C(2))-methyltransferase RlmN [Paludibacteraceae bacterium]|nr:23S rRNA (adenine(2503)-C(2))-methyltransferase RlmN [Paludibacteraceae bacterium]
MEILLGKTLSELQSVAEQCGLPKYAGKQLADWLYVKRVTSIDEMTNISAKGRMALKSTYAVGRVNPSAQAVSADGTAKYLFAVNNGQVVESVYIPETDRATVCISTQAGCKMGCKFCMTGTLGFHGHLTAAEMLNQVFSIPQSDTLTNIVVMGEGEPMDNLDNVLRFLEIMTADYGPAWSPKRITVSSVGLLPGLKRYLDASDCHLAVSLHNPFHIEREQIMPVEHAYYINKVIELLKQYDFNHQRRVSFEYICWGGINDTPKHANELLRLLKGLTCRINLIRYHDGGQASFPSSDEKQMQWLADYLSEHGITTTIRKSRGEDILAACGMLVNSLQK